MIKGVLVAIVSVVAISLAAYTFAPMLTQVTVSSSGSIKAAEIGIYWDSECSNKVTAITWGSLEPGSAINKLVYIKNQGNTAVTLSLSTDDWNPSAASNHIALSWNYVNQVINPNQIISVTLTLSVSSNIEGVTDFSFDIVITANS